MIRFSIFIFWLWIGFNVSDVTAQNRTKLESEKKKLLEEIELTRKLLRETDENKQKSISQLQTLRRQIQLREQVMKNLTTQLQLVEKQMSEVEWVVVSLERDLEMLKKNYATILINAYRNRSGLQEWLFVLSAKDLFDGYRRLRYLRELGAFRRRQVDLILDTQEMLRNRLQELEKKKIAQMQLLAEEQVQKQKLQAEKQEQDQLVAQLMKQEKQLKQDIRNQQASAEKLDKKIQDIIRKEIEAARKKAETQAKKTGTPALRLTPEEAKLSSQFATNKAKLPWPVEKGLISSTFGEHPHPLFTSLKVNNNGINIKTEIDAKVRSVFDGVVVNVAFSPAFQKAVIVRHGDFFTVYTNLKEVYVKANDPVFTKQVIGMVYTDEKENRTEVHFEVWQEVNKLNPAQWLTPQ